MESPLSENYTTDTLRVIIPVGGEAKRLKPLKAEVSKAYVRHLRKAYDRNFSLFSETGR